MNTPEGRISSNIAPYYPDSLEAYSQNVNIANVRDKVYGYFVCWIVAAYDALPESETNKIGKVASQFSMGEKNVQAALEYRERYRDVIEARITLNDAYSNPAEVQKDSHTSAETVLFDAQNRKDPLLSFDNEQS